MATSSVTNWGTTEAAITDTTLVTTSATFTPAPDSVLVVLADSRVSAGPFFPIISDTFADSGGTGWTSGVDNLLGSNPTWMAIWTRQVGTGAMPGTVTVNTSADTVSTDRFVVATVCEVSWALSPTPAQVKNDNNTSAAITLTFDSVPVGTSVVFSCVGTTNGLGPPVEPPGYHILDARVTLNGDAWAAAYLAGGGQSVSWSGLNTTATWGCAVEISATADASGVNIRQVATST